MTMLLCDFHVHIHPCFHGASALQAAYENFSALAGKRDDGQFTAVLFLAETRADQWFDHVRNRGHVDGQWQAESTAETVSLYLHNHGQGIYVVQGWQGNTRERLEILALATPERIREGRPLSETVRAILDSGGIPVIPWGAGKWLGTRGKILSSFLSQETAEAFLGDNGGRPGGWAEPTHFRRALSQGMAVLPGSDPLPIGGEERRIGSYCGAIHGSVPDGAIVAHIRRLLADRVPVEAMGSRVSPFTFVLNQFAVRTNTRPA